MGILRDKEEVMKAVLLSAGMGTRLMPLTEEIPKCLIELGGITMLERWIQIPKHQGVQM